MASPRPLLVLSTVAAALVALAACTVDPATSPTSPTDLATSAAPAASASPAAYTEPVGVPGEIARSVYGVVDGVPSTSSEMSDTVRAGEAVVVEGQCEGGTWLQYTLRDARPEGDGAQLASGSLRCDGAPQTSEPYTARSDGPVQLSLTVADATVRAWIVARR